VMCCVNKSRKVFGYFIISIEGGVGGGGVWGEAKVGIRFKRSFQFSARLCPSK